MPERERKIPPDLGKIIQQAQFFISNLEKDLKNNWKFSKTKEKNK